MMGTMFCQYETPCGWCVRLNKECPEKGGCKPKKAKAVAHEKEEKLLKEHNQKMKDIENELTLKKEKEVNELKEKIMTLELKAKEIINQYEQKIEKIIEEDRKKLNEQNKFSQGRIKSLEDELFNRENDYMLLEETSKANLAQKTKEYEFRFKKLQQELKTRVKEIENEKDELNHSLENLKKEK